MKRILIINPFGIGDVLFTTPLVSNLKDAFPDSFIGYVCNARARDILSGNRRIDKIFVYEKDVFRVLWKASKLLCIKELFRLLLSIKRQRFDVVFDLSMAQEYGLFSWLLGISTRVGYNYKNRGVFLTDRISIDGYDKKHIAEYYTDLLQLVDVQPRATGLEFQVDEGDRRSADNFLREHGVSHEDSLVGIIPGGGASWGPSSFRKHWPVNRFAALADRIASRPNTKIVLFGDINEMGLCNQAASLMKAPAILACGRTTLGEFAAMLKRCVFAVCNDGGPLHIAVSQGVKTVSIFGPVNPDVYGPYPKEGHVVISRGMACQPCYQKFKLRECGHMDCLSDITVEEVLGKIQ
ncbi:MAG: glycosyltransferase family 9 protein [Candidatus Omnitrophota bacterium]